VTVIDLHPQRRRLITTPAKPDGDPAGDGPRRRLTTRHVVRGHWTHQPHGPQRALRRLQWVDDYIRGPQDALVGERARDMALPESMHQTAAAQAASEIGGSDVDGTAV